MQDSRVWIAGLGDEGGSGNWLALAMKEFGQPDREEVAKLEQFVQRVLWGNLQFKDGRTRMECARASSSTIRRSCPISPTTGTSTGEAGPHGAADDRRRGPRLQLPARRGGLLVAVPRLRATTPGAGQEPPWEWYLDQAYKTTEFITGRDARGRDRVGYWRLGLMDGSVFMALLEDLKREGWSDKGGTHRAPHAGARRPLEERAVPVRQ